MCILFSCTVPPASPKNRRKTTFSIRVQETPRRIRTKQFFRLSEEKKTMYANSLLEHPLPNVFDAVQYYRTQYVRARLFYFFYFFSPFFASAELMIPGSELFFFLFFFLLAFLSIVLHRMTKCVSTLINWKEEKKTKTKKRNTKYARRTPARQTPFGRWP